MDLNRRSRIVALLSEEDARELSMARLCHVCTDITGTSGAGVMLLSDDVPYGSLCTTDGLSARLEDLQFTMGEGPCLDAYHHDHPVIEPDLATPHVARWLAFTTPALAAGAKAVFSFPLRSGGVRLGTLNLYRDRTGSLDEDELANAQVIADLIGETVLALQAKAPRGSMAVGLERNANFQPVVNQAAGMVAVQLGVTVLQALVRLRAYAFANACLLGDVAANVVGRRLRFPDADAEADG